MSSVSHISRQKGMGAQTHAIGIRLRNSIVAQDARLRPLPQGQILAVARHACKLLGIVKLGVG